MAEFRTAAGARDEVASEIASPHAPGMWVAFPVADIPGAHGFTFGQELHCVMFSDGRFQYGLGAGAVTSAARAPTEAQVIAGAQALYRRVHSR